MKWLELRDEGKVHKVHIKHMVEDADDISLGAIVQAKFNRKIYRATVVDILAWKPRVRHKRNRRKQQRKENVCKLIHKRFFICKFIFNLPYVGKRKTIKKGPTT